MRKGDDPKICVYLSKYGYMEEIDMDSSAPIIKASELVESLKQFQSFMGLPVTGRLNKATIKMMSMARCGVKDITARTQQRVKRFAMQGSTWKKKHITYRINKYPKNLRKEDVDIMVHKAFNLWSNHSELTFEACKNSSRIVDIDIAFVKGKHGDDTSFEGPGGILAHAFFPQFGGDVHFDDSETWTINSVEGTNLLQVANHEIGHSLGLSHSEELSASMSPLYNDYIPDFMLHMDDIQGIQKLYGKKTIQKPRKLEKTSQEIWDDYWNGLPDL
ncbi:macrophage metalloelastase-like [Coccinella septempunctata]|uniref:macrophage metalloelastase-like n=1 Tax=Coccinella septempunctata TaxID=41139 RepID=UPI001D08428D|nr:macrophage metalloelastase-like [Coccinella septempunctata]